MISSNQALNGPSKISQRNQVCLLYTLMCIKLINISLKCIVSVLVVCGVTSLALALIRIPSLWTTRIVNGSVIPSGCSLEGNR